MLRNKFAWYVIFLVMVVVIYVFVDHKTVEVINAGTVNKMTNEDVVKQLGLFNEIQLDQPTKTINGKHITSPFFNSSQNGELINFVIKLSDGETFVVNKVSGLFRVVEDNSKTLPTVQFKFNDKVLPEIIKEEWVKKGPQWFIDNYSDVIFVKISRKDLEKEGVFPF